MKKIDRKMRLISSINRLNSLKYQKLINCRKFCSHLNDISPEVLSQYESVIGLEVHSQINTNSKLFSSSGTSYTSAPNTQVSYFDCALPGTLPVLNRKCVESTVLTGLSLNCQISKRSEFDRKHYFYADMPSGYQITQQRHPLATNGFIDFIVFSAKDPTKSYLKRSILKQIQLEQDSGKSLQDETNNRALVDLNRAGVGLMEFVFEPDLRSADEAIGLVQHLVLILKSINTSSCKMQEGVLRVDANVSVRKPNEMLGIRTEVKNLNSFRFIHSAIEYEIKRQILVIESGAKVVNETRMYDMKLKKTIPMRDKEVVQDYRFMPEPNIPPILLSDDKDFHKNNLINISDIKQQINGKEMPNQLRERLLKEYGLSLGQVFVLMTENGMTRLFHEIAKRSHFKNYDFIFKFMDSDLRIALEENKQNFASYSVDLQSMAEIIDLLISEKISSGIGNRLLRLYFQKQNKTPNEMVLENEWTIINDMKTIEEMCLKTIKTHQKIARKYAKTGIRRPNSMLIQNVMNLSDNRVNESNIWLQFDRILRNTKCDQNNE